jgi:hypothetical protein
VYSGAFTCGATGALAAGTDTAVALNGGRVTVPYSPSLNTKAFSAEYWYYPSNASGQVTIGNIQYPNNPVRKGWCVLSYADHWGFRLYDPSGGSLTFNTPAVAGSVNGKWTHVAVTYDGTSNAVVYLDGVIAVTGVQTNFAPNPESALTFGLRIDGYAVPGMGDELALYTNALSFSAIAAHYAAGTNSAVDAHASTVLADNPVGYWRLNEPV